METGFEYVATVEGSKGVFFLERNTEKQRNSGQLFPHDAQRTVATQISMDTLIPPPKERNMRDLPCVFGCDVVSVQSIWCVQICCETVPVLLGMMVLRAMPGRGCSMFDPQSHAYYFAMLFVGSMLLIKDGVRMSWKRGLSARGQSGQPLSVLVQ